MNSHEIKSNCRENTTNPVITVKKNKQNIYGHEVEIPGGCRVVYSPDKANSGGAKVWIETLYDVIVTCWDKGNLAFT